MGHGTQYYVKASSIPRAVSVLTGLKIKGDKSQVYLYLSSPLLHDIYSSTS